MRGRQQTIQTAQHGERFHACHAPRTNSARLRRSAGGSIGSTGNPSRLPASAPAPVRLLWPLRPPRLTPLPPALVPAPTPRRRRKPASRLPPLVSEAEVPPPAPTSSPRPAPPTTHGVKRTCSSPDVLQAQACRGEARHVHDRTRARRPMAATHRTQQGPRTDGIARTSQAHLRQRCHRHWRRHRLPAVVARRLSCSARMRAGRSPVVAQARHAHVRLHTSAYTTCAVHIP